MSEKKEVKKGFTKEQFMKSDQYTGVQKDILSIVLGDEKYTHNQAKKAIDDFNKRKVK